MDKFVSRIGSTGRVRSLQLVGIIIVYGRILLEFPFLLSAIPLTAPFQLGVSACIVAQVLLALQLM